MYLGPRDELSGTASPPVLIDFAPEAAAPETENDLAPGEESMESEEEPLPEVKQEVVEEPIVEVPPTQTPDPEIVIPPKKEEVVEKKEEPTPKPPEPVKEKPVEKSKKSIKQQFSSPKTEKRARSAVAPNPGTAGSSSALPNYKSLISAHINRFKRPASGSGTAVVSFVVDRSGRVVSRSLARSSGNPTVDAEAMATIGRAAPAFPAAVTQSSLAFTQAIRFN
jgi:protein TonB